METFQVHFDGSFSPWTTKIAAYGFIIHKNGKLVNVQEIRDLRPIGNGIELLIENG